MWAARGDLQDCKTARIGWISASSTARTDASNRAREVSKVADVRGATVAACGLRPVSRCGSRSERGRQDGTEGAGRGAEERV